MPCYPWHTDLPKRMHGFMCSPEPLTVCWVCGEPAVYLCDYPAGPHYLVGQAMGGIRQDCGDTADAYWRCPPGRWC